LLDQDLVALAPPVRLELLAGAGRSQVGKLQSLLDALPVFTPSADTWQLVERWVVQSARAGHHFGVLDLLIGALATERGAAVWSLDADFERLVRLKLVKAHRALK
jgi:predicted nucleic acid-binding protein